MLVLHRNTCCDPSSELSQWDGSDEGSQNIVPMRSKKNYPSIIIKYSYLELNSSQVCVREKILGDWQTVPLLIKLLL